MSGKWKFKDIDWSLFDPKKVDPEILRLMKAGSVIEHNGSDYGLYLKSVFKGDAPLLKEIEAWSKDEIKHGKVLAEWVRLADPSYDFEERFRTYTEGFPIDTTAKESIRGSRASELLTRCMVETGTSTFYTAIKQATKEPLLKQICGKIAADELRHYKLFYTHFKRYQKEEKLGLLRRIKVALGRLHFQNDDELAFAYYIANQETKPYDRAYYTKLYESIVYKCYQKIHVETGVAFFLKAVGLKPQGWIGKGVSSLAYRIFSYKLGALQRDLAKC